MADSLEKHYFFHSLVFFVFCVFFGQRQYRQVFLIFYTVNDLEHTLTIIWLSTSLSEISFLSTDCRSVLCLLNLILEGMEPQRQNFKVH